MSDIPGRFSTPPSTPPSVSTATPIETKEDPFEVTIHIPPPASAEGTPLPRVRTNATKPQTLVQWQEQVQAPTEDDVHGCCFRGCWSCVGCACFGGFLGALFWARAAAGH